MPNGSTQVKTKMATATKAVVAVSVAVGLAAIAYGFGFAPGGQEEVSQEMFGPSCEQACFEKNCYETPNGVLCDDKAYLACIETCVQPPPPIDEGPKPSGSTFMSCEERCSSEYCREMPAALVCDEPQYGSCLRACSGWTSPTTTEGMVTSPMEEMVTSTTSTR